MILIVGATGLLGSEVCRRLRAQDTPVRALVRAGSPKEAELRQLGVEVVYGDLRSRESLEAACRGASAVISTATSMGSKEKRNSVRVVDRDGQLALVEVAEQSGVGHFIFVSISPNYQERAPLMRYKREVERAIRASAMRWTILQPSNFMEVWLGSALGWDFSAGRAMIFGSGTNPVSWISVSDVADACVLAVEDPRLINRDLPLGGPEALAPNQVVQIFEEVSGRKYKVKRIPAPVLSALSPVVAWISENQASGMSLGAQAAGGDVVDSSLQRELPLNRTSVRDYAERVARPAAIR